MLKKLTITLLYRYQLPPIQIISQEILRKGLFNIHEISKSTETTIVFPKSRGINMKHQSRIKNISQLISKFRTPEGVMKAFFNMPNLSFLQPGPNHYFNSSKR